MPLTHRMGTRAFVIGGLILFGLGLLFISNRHQLLHRNFVVYADFDRLNGLHKGAQVRVSGMKAGEVLETKVPNQPDGRFRLKLRIRQNLHAIVRMDSVATIKTMGLAGNSFVDIGKGTRRAPEAPSGGTIPSREPLDIADLMQQGSDLMKTTQASVDDLRASADRTLASVNAAANHVDQAIIAARPELQAILASSRKTSEDVREIMARIKQGQGTVGKLLTDKRLAGSVDQTLENARQSAVNLNNASARMNDTMAEIQRRDLLERAQAILDNTQRVTNHLNQALATLMSSSPGDENAVTNLRDTIAGARTTMTNLAADTEALKNNFFLRGFFNRRGYFNLSQMTPQEYRSSQFVKGHSLERIWLSESELFSPGPDGKENLTKEGQQRIDDAMSALLAYLPNSPMVVEGYATGSSPSEEFIRAKQRASLVRRYIDKRFGLQPDRVGVMPMSFPIPSALGKSTWDGVSLVLIH